MLEGRGFYFPKRTVEWEPDPDRPLSAIEQALLARVLERIPPVELSRGGYRRRWGSRSASDASFPLTPVPSGTRLG